MTRRTEVTALALSVRGAARFGHAQWQAQGGPAALAVARGRVAVINGYPASGDLALLLEPPEAMAFSHARGRWQHHGLDASRPCGVSYAPPARMGAEPSVTLQVSGC